MSKNKGWVALYRDIQDHWLWQVKPFSKGQAWVDLILSVNHAPAKILVNNEIIQIERGQMWTSIRKLSERWGWGRNKTANYLKLLKSEDMVNVKTETHKGTLLTVLNYSDYQGFRNANEKTQDSDGDSDGTLTEPQTGHTRSHTRIINNNVNNANNDNNDSTMEQCIDTDSQFLQNKNMTPRYPSWNETRDYFLSNGSTEKVAKDFYECLAPDWLDKEGRPIRNWQAVANAYINRQITDYGGEDFDEEGNFNREYYDENRMLEDAEIIDDDAEPEPSDANRQY